MAQITLWHNPRCSKSRQSLELLREHGVEPEIRRYLDDPPDINELRQVIGRLQVSARELLRTGEAAFSERDLARPELDDDTLLEAMAQEPRLIQRPIALRGEQARIGRPPEAVLELLA